MREFGHIEIRAQFAIDPDEQIETELGRHAEAVVVGRFEDGRVLLQVDADQEAAAGAAEVDDASEQRGGLVREEVPKRRAGKVDRDLRRGERRPRQGERFREVGANRPHLDIGVILRQLARRLAQVIAGDVDGHVRGRPDQAVEQIARLHAAAAAEFDQHHAGAEPLPHLGGELFHQLQLGARDVVLVEFADAIEEDRAALVVEVLAGELLRRPSQAVEHVVKEGASRFRFLALGGCRLDRRVNHSAHVLKQKH